MKAQIRVDIENGVILVNSGFAKRAANYGTQEYMMLQNCRKDYPSFRVEKRSIETNPNKECYKGLTYEYMENYIRCYSENQKQDLLEFSDMKFISKCHSRRYPIIKRWFLDKFPEVEQFGMPDVNTIEVHNWERTTLSKAA